MINWIRKKIAKVSNLRLTNLELSIISGYIIVLFLFIIYAKINSDEYLYLSIANSIVDAIRGKGEIDDIDTWHTFLLPGILAIFKLVSGVNSVFASRIVVVLFSIGSILLLHKLFQKLFSELIIFRSGIIVLLLMFPGFFYFGSMILLDNIAFFFFILLIYYIVDKKEYWKIGIVLAVLSLAKEYYIVFGGFVIFVAIVYDLFFNLFSSQKETEILEQFKSFVQNLLTAYWLSLIVLGSILVFPILPYASLLGIFMLEIFGNNYFVLGGIFNELIFSSSSSVALIDNGLNVAKDGVNGFKDAGLEISNSTSSLSRIFATRETPAGFIKYFNRIFKEVYLNIYIIPLSLYGIYVYFIDSKQRWNKNGIVILSVLIAFILFFSRTAHLGLGDFRFVFIVIVPFLFFSIFAIKDLLKVSKFKFRHYVFIIGTIIYIWMILGYIRNITSGGILYTTIWVQVLIKYKYTLNIILYMFPIIILLLTLKVSTKRKMLTAWLIIMFFYKSMPLLLNGYMIEQKSSIEYNLVEAKNVLNRVETDNPRVLTNYRRAYYYYSDSDNFPNNTRKNLPIIRPKPSVIHEERVVRAKDNVFLSLTSSYLCDKNVDYIFYVNREFNNKSNIINLITGIDGVSIEKDFYERNILSWGIYKFDNRVCK